MVPQEWYGQQQQYSVIEIERQPQPQYDQRAMYQHQKPMHQHQPMQYEPRPVHYMERPMPVPQPRVEYVQQQMPPPVPKPQGLAVATVGIALWQQGRYLAIASITPGSDASQCGLKVRTFSPLPARGGGGLARAAALDGCAAARGGVRRRGKTLLRAT